MQNIEYKKLEKCGNCAAILPLPAEETIIKCEFCGTPYITGGPVRLLIKKRLAEQYADDFFKYGGCLQFEEMITPQMPEFYGLLHPKV